MNFNLSELSKAINCKLEQPTPAPIEFYLTDDNWILSKMGENAYYFNYEKLHDVLNINQFSFDPKSDVHNRMYDLLSKHILNQHFAALGEKVYQEVVSHQSDLIK